MEITNSSGIYKTDLIVVIIYCYLDEDNDKVLEINMHNTFCFITRVLIFLALPLIIITP